MVVLCTPSIGGVTNVRISKHGINVGKNWISVISSHFQTFPSFWPEQQRSKKYGQVFTVEHQSHAHTPNIRSWVFKINKKVRPGLEG